MASAPRGSPRQAPFYLGTAEGQRIIAATACLLTMTTVGTLAVKFMFMSCFSDGPEPATCPASPAGNATAQELFKKEGCSANEGCTAWEHPVLTVAFNHVMMILFLPLHHLTRLQQHGDYSELEDCKPDGDKAGARWRQGRCRHLPPLQCFAAGTMQGIGGILDYWGFTMLYASTFSMVRTTAQIIITAALSKSFLARNLHVHHAYGMLLVLGERLALQ